MTIYKAVKTNQFPGARFPYLVVYRNTKCIDKNLVSYTYDYYEDLFKDKQCYMTQNPDPIPKDYQEIDANDIEWPKIVDVVKMMLRWDYQPYFVRTHG
jgi:hypothetical protein